MPAVLMNKWSPLPLSTTLVSPVMMDTPTASAAWRIEETTFQSVSMGNPSSMMKAALR